MEVESNSLNNLSIYYVPNISIYLIFGERNLEINNNDKFDIKPKIYLVPSSRYQIDNILVLLFLEQGNY